MLFRLQTDMWGPRFDHDDVVTGMNTNTIRPPTARFQRRDCWGLVPRQKIQGNQTTHPNCPPKGVFLALKSLLFATIYKERPRLLCPHRLGRNRAGQLRVLCYQYGGESESGLEPIGSAANWRCVVLEKLRKVELLEGSWKTAPNHSRPTTCVIDADIDAEDQPERPPQQGQRGIIPSR